MEPELHAVRRLDWRFLLPEPDLARVACLGPADDELVNALRRFAGAVHPGPNANPSTADEPYDVVVSRVTGSGSVEAAARAAAPGGTLYLELPGSWRLRPALHGRRLEARLAILGFDQVHPLWLWPRASAPTLICPVHAASIRAAVRRRGSRRRVAGWIVGIAARFGVVHWVLGDVAVLATRSASRA